jgi:lipoate---protein ligase
LSTTTGSAWPLERHQGSAQQLHLASAARLAEASLETRTARLLQVTRPAIVLGSTQAASDVDEEAAASLGVDVARRRSGGGAVLVDPAELVWVDLILPVRDPLWEADIGKAPWWVGAAWASAIDRIGAGPAHVWQGPMQSSPWSKRICFAGLGSGEVLVGGRKVVGVSQRRTRYGALFQTAALLRWDPSELLDLLQLTADERAQGKRELASVAAGLGAARGDELLAHLLAALPA